MVATGRLCEILSIMLWPIQVQTVLKTVLSRVKPTTGIFLNMKKYFPVRPLETVQVFWGILMVNLFHNRVLKKLSLPNKA